MIESYFGTQHTADLTFERYTTAILRATVAPPAAPSDEFRLAMEVSGCGRMRQGCIASMPA